jgi:cyclic dehypoxanthinyl futalosine synthase
MNRLSEDALRRVFEGGRLSTGEALGLYSMDLHRLAAAAHRARARKSAPDTVTFVVDRNISYTNVCVSECDFCAYYEKPGSPRSLTLSSDEILARVGELVTAGGTQVLLQGGLNPAVSFDFHLRLLERIRREFPTVAVHSYSPPEIEFFARQENAATGEILRRLKEAGLHSLPGGGGEILVERVRRLISPRKISALRWLEIQREAHGLGLRSTATMVFAHAETLEERIRHLERIRDLQDETQGFRAFIPWTMSTPGTRISGMRRTAGEDYLRTVAVSRLFLDNIPHLQAGWVTEGPALSQLALFFGADDMGGTVMEENVLRPTGLSHEMTREKMARLIRRAGFRPARRNTRYEILGYE